MQSSHPLSVFYLKVEQVSETLKNIQNFTQLLSDKWYFKSRIAWPQPNNSFSSIRTVRNTHSAHQVYPPAVLLLLLRVKYNTSLSNCKGPWLHVFNSHSPHEQLWKASSCTISGSWSFLSETIRQEGSLGTDLAAHWHGIGHTEALGITKDVNPAGGWQMSFIVLIHQKHFTVSFCLRLCPQAT